MKVGLKNGKKKLPFQKPNYPNSEHLKRGNGTGEKGAKKGKLRP